MVAQSCRADSQMKAQKTCVDGGPEIPSPRRGKTGPADSTAGRTGGKGQLPNEAEADRPTAPGVFAKDCLAPAHHRRSEQYPPQAPAR